ncbi:hypothetical protein I6A60_32880 [Frankia sp. AgB1.9]|uniref:hypothetical protein n=1 Tax=unclassified Frankia TaxID=2632575 RepID=UPI0019321D9A|nr:MULTISPECIES: hypothetical protein [unclassified Frankia]MBL7489777.1 hypothetical protein [Frankia sp. AgW1.1]MBL7552620.1 hypothetical protein [Frankia sp. AgB1.9]MBL7623708.1 hypothetical protein [Frankia sp. AgB1.8]
MKPQATLVALLADRLLERGIGRDLTGRDGVTSPGPQAATAADRDAVTSPH